VCLHESALERFSARINFTASCHWWEAQTDDDGYGIFPVNGGKERAHRVAYYIEHGQLPPVVRHTCDNPSCVNPAHLEGGTQQDNIRDRQARDRQAKGHENGRSKLDEETVYRCRKRCQEGASYRQLGRELEVDWTTVRAAVRGETWSHVPMPS